MKTKFEDIYRMFFQCSFERMDGNVYCKYNNSNFKFCLGGISRSGWSRFIIQYFNG